MVERIEKLVRIDMTRFGEYSPCKSPEVVAKQLGIPESQIVKLDANENPYGCSPRVLKALARYPYFNIYPDAAQTELRKQLAAYTGIEEKYLVAGNGSDELIDLLLRALLGPGDETITVVPTFDMYRFCTQVCCGTTVPVQRRSDFTVDVGAVKAAITRNTKMIFVANPNNPTGTMISRSDILDLLDTEIPLVIDEAYYEFAGETVAPMVLKSERLIVLRTFSKWAGLAGLRVGYGILPERLATILLKIKPPYNVNLAAAVAVKESILDSAYLLDTVDKLVKERESLFKRLKQIDYLRPIPSRANFVLCEVLRGNAAEIQHSLETQGILVRYYNTPLLKNYIRISAGKPEQTEQVITALKKIGT